MRQLILFILICCFTSLSQAETELVLVKEQLIPKVYSAPGYTAALNKIEISTKHTGFITQLLVEAGDVIENFEAGVYTMSGVIKLGAFVTSFDSHIDKSEKFIEEAETGVVISEPNIWVKRGAIVLGLMFVKRLIFGK